jgi:hypothetical protein
MELKSEIPIQLGFACNEKRGKHYRAKLELLEAVETGPEAKPVSFLLLHPSYIGQITRVRSRQDAIRKISWMGVYRAGRLVNVRSGGNLVSDSVVSGESTQARRGPSCDDSSALHRWCAILDFWRRIISNQSEQAPGVGRFLTPSPANTAKRIVVASFSFCVSLVSD